MLSIVTSVLMVLALILVVGFCSLAEFSLGFVQKWRLRDRAGHGDRGAQAALELGRDFDKFVTSSRLVATFAIVLAGLLCGRLIGSGENGPADPGLATYWEAAVITAVVAAVTAVALLFGDLMPRSLARSRPEVFASMLGRAMRVLSLVVSPAVFCLRRLNGRLSQWLGGQGVEPPSATEQKIKDLMREGAESGGFEESKHAIFKRALRFCDRRARALMTPRNKVVWLDVHDQPEEILRKIATSMNTSFPVCDETLDNLLGIVQLKELLVRGAEGQLFRFKGLLTLPAFIYEGMRGPQILDILKKSAAHTAVVLDEYGSVVGVLTLTDIQEAILGTMTEKPDQEEPRAVQRPDGSWLLDGRFPIDEFFDLFHIHETLEGEFDTLGGLVVTKLGRIPRIGESFERLGLRFEVVDMDDNRVHRVLVRPLNLHT